MLSCSRFECCPGERNKRLKDNVLRMLLPQEEERRKRREQKKLRRARKELLLQQQAQVPVSFSSFQMLLRNFRCAEDSNPDDRAMKTWTHVEEDWNSHKKRWLKIMSTN